MNEFGEPFTFNIINGFDDIKVNKAGLLIEIINGGVVITMNSQKAYRVLSNKHIIVGALNKKLSELIQLKLEGLAKEEEGLENGR